MQLKGRDRRGPGGFGEPGLGLLFEGMAGGGRIETRLKLSRRRNVLSYLLCPNGTSIAAFIGSRQMDRLLSCRYQILPRHNNGMAAWMDTLMRDKGRNCTPSSLRGE